MAGKKCNLFCITFFLVLFYIPLIALLILTSLELDYYRSIDKGLLLALLDFLYYVFLTIIWHPFYHVCLAVFYESIRPNDEEIDNFQPNQPNQQIGEQSIVIG